MRAKVVAAVVGLVLTIGGVALLGFGITRIAATPTSSECVGDECLGDPSILAMPAGIIAMVIGLIVASWALASIRSERGPGGPLRAFGFMSGLGGLFLGLGIIFLITSSAGSDADGTFVFLGALFGLMGLVFIGIDVLRFRGELRKDRLRVSGLKGSARVVGVSDTNITVNNSPMVNLDLEVTVPGQPPFRARRRTVISRLSVGALTTGYVIPVLADPAKPRDIVLDWDGAPPAENPAISAMGDNPFAQMMNTWLSTGLGGTQVVGTSTLPTSQILRDVSQALANAATRAEAGGATTARLPDGTTVIDGGTSSAGESAVPAAVPTPVAPRTPFTLSADSLPARVTLDAIRDTGVDVAGSRLYEFDLTVLVAGRQPYQIKHSATVPRALVPRLMIGASFPADVDPAQPGQVAVQFDH